MKTIEEIHKIRAEKRKEIEAKKPISQKTIEKQILVCGDKDALLEDLRKSLESRKIYNVKAIKTEGLKLSEEGTVVAVRPEDIFYVINTKEDCEEIVKTHIVGGNIVESLLLKGVEGAKNKLDNLPFYKKQEKIALKNYGLIDPEDIDEYIALDGYKALEKVLCRNESG